MKKGNKVRESLLVYTLIISMVFAMLPTNVFAEDTINTETSGLKECHLSHDESCGYKVITTMNECNHAHDENCNYDETVPDNVCAHEHNESCGYGEITTILPCTHECEQCKEQESSEPNPPVCDCTELCTETTINESCLVCKTNWEMCAIPKSDTNSDSTILTMDNEVSIIATTFNTVYCDPLNGMMGNDGSSVDMPAFTLADAIKSVSPGGIIYMMSTEKFKYGDTTIDGKGATVKPYTDLDNMIINLQNNKDITLKNITFDGSDYSGSYNFDMIQVSRGTLTLGEGTVLENFETPDYGAAISVYGSDGAILTLDGCIIKNNACGKLGGSYTGGVYVSGTLILKSGSITGNTLKNNTIASDVWLADDGIFKLSGNATVGTVVLANKADNAVAKVELVSTLQNGFQARAAEYLNFGAGILLPDLNSGRIVAEGGDGYTLTEDDFKKIKIADSKSVDLKYADTQAIVALKSYSITKKALGNGAITIADSAVWGTPVIFSVVPNKGYTISTDTVKVKQGAFFTSLTINNNGTYQFTMPTSSVIVEAEFLAINYNITKEVLENGAITIVDSAIGGTEITFSVEPDEGYTVAPGSVKVKQGTSIISLTDHGDGTYKFIMPAGSVTVEAEFIQNKQLQLQTFADTDHEISGLPGTYLYILEAGIDSTMALSMANSTVFEPKDTPPVPLISFVLPAVDTGTIGLNGNVMTPLKFGEVTVQAIAKETVSHNELKQNITVKVVAPTKVKLTFLSYVNEGKAETDGITILPSKIPNEYGINESTRSLAYRKVGTDIWTTISADNWNWDMEYLLPFSTLEKNATYNLRLTVNNNRRPISGTAESTLSFSTPIAGLVNQGGVEGTVTGMGDISITVQRGNSVIASVAGLQSNDKFSFINLPDGFYNLVATDQKYIVTKIVRVKDGKTTTLNVDIVGKKESAVNIEATIPQIAVGGLQELFDKPIYLQDTDATDAFTGGGTVEMRLTAMEAKQQQIDFIKAVAINQTIGVAMDLTVDKVITPNSGIPIVKNVRDTEALIEIAIPLPKEAQGKTGYKVFRSHDGLVEEISMLQDSNLPGIEGFQIDGIYIYIYAQKFSVYAIAYDKIGGGGSSGGGNGGGGGSSSVEEHIITATSNTGGLISPSGKVSVKKNTSKTFTITPDAGYIVDNVLVDGKNMGSVTSYTFEKVSESHTIIASFQADDKIDLQLEGLPYYVKNGKDIFIGFATDVEDKMTYIAPSDVKVLFRLNPKQFYDIDGHWAKDWIDFVTEREIFVGTSEDMFAPNTGMSRAMFVTVMGRLYERSFGNVSTISNHIFSDVNYDSWYAPYLNWCVETDIVKGMDENHFEPDREITRQEMAVMLERFAIVLDKRSKDNGMVLTYSDTEKIDVWALSGASYSQQTSIITGREGGNFAPKEIASRAEVAVMIRQFVTEIVKY